MAFLPVPAILLIEPGLERIEIVEGMGCLHESELFIMEVADQACDEIRLGNVVGVQNDNELAIGLFKGMIEVARLGMAIVGPDHVLNAQLLREGLDSGPFAVVANIGLMR